MDSRTLESNGKVSWKYQSCYHSITLSLSSREFPALISAYRRSRCAMLVEDLERSCFATCCQLECYNFEAFQVLHCESRPGTPGNHIVQKVTAQPPLNTKHRPAAQGIMYIRSGMTQHIIHNRPGTTQHIIIHNRPVLLKAGLLQPAWLKMKNDRDFTPVGKEAPPKTEQRLNNHSLAFLWMPWPCLCKECRQDGLPHAGILRP